MSKAYSNEKWADQVESVLEQDRQMCTNCGTVLTREDLDVDHRVPRGAGGSDRSSNLGTLCRVCHDAKHGLGIAPGAQLKSTGNMTDTEFRWFKHLLQEMIPAMARILGVQLVPKFRLNDDDMWHLPLGDLRLLNAKLVKADEDYSSLNQFMSYDAPQGVHQ